MFGGNKPFSFSTPVAGAPGTTNSPAAQASPFSFGGSAASTQPAAAGGALGSSFSFGGSSSFGGAAASTATSTAAPATGLFGAAKPATSSTSIFGQSS